MRGKRSRTGEKEKWNCDAGATKSQPFSWQPWSWGPFRGVPNQTREVGLCTLISNSPWTQVALGMGVKQLTLAQGKSQGGTKL